MELYVAIITMAVTIASFYLAIRSALKENELRINNGILHNEKRHSDHERAIALIDQKIDSIKALFEEKIKTKINYAIK